jgi:hypothetical protein
MTPAEPTKPSLETCAGLIHAARKAMHIARNAGDEDEFEQARTVYLALHRVAYRHGHSPTELRAALAALDNPQSQLVVGN